MIRRWRHYKRVLGNFSASKNRGSGRPPRQYWVEQLEPRYLLSASSLGNQSPLFDLEVLGGLGVIPTTLASNSSLPAGTPEIGISPPPPTNSGGGATLANGALLPTAPFPLEDTFFLHSLPGATKTIYLDFDGFTTRDTQWNTDFNLPNIVTPVYDFDGDLLTFSYEERLAIQTIWERVAEDYRPFEVDVTTEDPGVEALRNTGGNDQAWGQRVVIGGSTNDWYTPVNGKAVGGVSYGSFPWDSDTPNFVFGGDYINPADIAEAASHETGHSVGLTHDSQFRFYSDIGKDPPETVRLFVEYYGGHGSGETAWAPIMGVSYGKNLTQWSKAEYFNGTNDKAGANPLQDDLEVITNRDGNNGNGFGYRADDHGDTTAMASPVVPDPLTADSDTSLFEGEGIIERNTDIDFFSFTVDGLGELVSLDIQPFYNGPNLDVLAKLSDSSGTVIATSDSIDVLGATFTDEALLPGTYYVSVQGASRPITFIDPVFHPGPFEAEGNPPDPPLPPDTSDWGYTNYGSLGYYSIVGTRKKNLVVGVDFDDANGSSPENWTLYAGGDTDKTIKNLVSEAGQVTPYQLTIQTTGASPIATVASPNPIDPADIPNHGLPLDGLDGYISAEDETLSFIWGNLEPSTVYQVYVFGHAGADAKNDVHVVGGQWNGTLQTFDYVQNVSADGLVTNGNMPGSNDLSTYSLLVISDASGEITITVTNETGFIAAIAGVAIAPTKVGSIQGQKWNDVNGDRVHDASEAGLPNWVIYLDVNNDGILNSTSDQDLTVASPDIPQAIHDYTTVKSELSFEEVGTIADIDVMLDITHTYDSDVKVYLVSPSGTRVKLVQNATPQDPEGDNFTATVFDDAAPTGILSGAAPFTGRYRPIEPLSVLNGEDAVGVWNLEITDDATGDEGVLNSWSITVKLQGVFLEPFQITDADGNYAFTDLPAGQYFIREDISEQQAADGWRQSFAPSPVTVRSGADILGIDFGNWIPTTQHGSIAGQKFNDFNSDGVNDGNEPGLSNWIVYIDSDNDGTRDLGSDPVTINATGLPQPITDFSTTTSSVSFNELGTVFSVRVTLDVTHSFVGDLDAFLISPSGRQVELFTAVGGQYNDLHNLTLDDAATRSIATIGVNDLPFTGTWKPEGLLSDFIGESATGLWTLLIRDNAFADQGTLNSWSLEIKSGEVYLTTDADGNYAFPDLPAGQYVIREEQKPGWTQVPPQVASIPAAEYANSQWTVTVAAQDDPNDTPPDSHRNVKNVDFGNHSQMLLGDYNHDNVVDAGDYVMYRRTVGQTVPQFTGADGDGDGVVGPGDLLVWRQHYGETNGSGSGQELAEAPQPAPAPDASPAAAGIALATSNVADGELVAAPTASVSASTVGQAARPENAALRSFDSYSTGNSRIRGRDRHFGRPALNGGSHHDAGLLAWLSSSKNEGRANNDAAMGLRIASDAEGDDLNSVDAVFESLKEFTLAAAGVV